MVRDPISIKLGDLDVLCAVLGCGIDELLVPEQVSTARPRLAAVSRGTEPRARVLAGRAIEPVTELPEGDGRGFGGR